MNQPSVVPHEVDRHVKVDVLDFNGEQSAEVFLDWKHRVKAFFKWNKVPERRKLQFTEAKLMGTARIWWNTDKKESFQVQQ